MRNDLQKRVNALHVRANNLYKVWMDHNSIDNFYRWVDANNKFVAEWNLLKRDS